MTGAGRPNRYWPNRYWPNRYWPNRYWPNRYWPNRYWNGWNWATVLAAAWLVSLWIAVSPIRLADGTLFQLFQVGILSVCAAWLAYLLRHLERLSAVLAGAGVMLAAWPVLRLLNHISMANSMPFADPWISALDHAIGFDWLAYSLWVDQNYWLRYAMDQAYTRLDHYAALLFLLLALRSNARERCGEFIRLFLWTALFCMGVGALFPAEAAMLYYAPDESLFLWATHDTGSYHMQSLTALRTDPGHVLHLQQLPGLVTFPSFHTAMGVIAIYCSRGTWWLFGPMLAINLLMIASTPVFGSHYAADIIAGTIVALGMIAIHRTFFSNAPVPTDGMAVTKPIPAPLAV
ncbi:MAG: phosphatase PAP2 family protein [Pontixanthobacter sp.]